VGIPVINKIATKDSDAERTPDMLHTNYRTMGFVVVRERMYGP